MGNDGKKTLTVFTPAYNRAHTLGRTYHSLCRQGCKDFIWLVVDDGSTDGTAELVREWKEQIADLKSATSIRKMAECIRRIIQLMKTSIRN